MAGAEGPAVSLRTMLEAAEGRRDTAYPDPLTGGEPWTIGIGHTGPEVVQGLTWTNEQIDAAFDVDMEIARSGCERVMPWLDKLNDPRQAVLVAMAFQMGLGRLLGFQRMLAACRDEHYAHAAEEMRQSMWARQTPRRAVRMAYQMESGAWQWS